jgi:SAM-dependent methyltransferase
LCDLLTVDAVDAWLRALEERHFADLMPPEVARALRALSSCYVERRAKLAQGGALHTAGKRAAFALFYGPLHFFVTREIVRALDGAAPVGRILDLGCGTGAAGAAWALERGRCTVNGIDRHPWAAAEANWTYRALGLTGHAAQGTIDRSPIRGRRGEGILAAYAVNELADTSRAALLSRLLAAHAGGSRVLVIEPIARRLTGWWTKWEQAFVAAGGRGDEWRFPAELPERQRQLARAAGLQPRELTARSLWIA